MTGDFYKENRGRLFAYLMRMSGDYHVSNDILQESYVKYLERYGKKEPTLRLLYTIARNTFIDHVRKQGRMSSLETECADMSENQERHYLVREEYRLMLDALSKLGKDDRDLLALVADGGLSYREIAGIVGVSEGNVKVRVHRARIKLGEILAK